MTEKQPELLLCFHSLATGVLGGGGQRRSRDFNSLLYLKQCRLTTNKQTIARTQSQTHTQLSAANITTPCTIVLLVS